MNGNETLSVQNIKYEGKATMLETPIREGYRFIKWNTRMDGNGRLQCQ
ncbi:MAG: InlB B-repeat-containing protein [Longibaculum sp.]